MAETRPYHGLTTRHGFTLIELLIVVAIISLLLSIMVPAYRAAKEIARQTVCLTQLRAIGIAVEGYSTKFGCRLAESPPGKLWQPCPERQLLQAQLVTVQETFFCPSDSPNSYAETPTLFERADTGVQVQGLFWPGPQDDGKVKFVRQMDRFDRAPPFEWLQSSYMWNECQLEDENVLDGSTPAEIGIVSEGNHVANRRDWGCLAVPVGADRRRDQVHRRETVNFLFGDSHAGNVPLDQVGTIPSKP